MDEVATVQQNVSTEVIAPVEIVSEYDQSLIGNIKIFFHILFRLLMTQLLMHLALLVVLSMFIRV